MPGVSEPWKIYPPSLSDSYWRQSPAQAYRMRLSLSRGGSIWTAAPSQLSFILHSEPSPYSSHLECLLWTTLHTELACWLVACANTLPCNHICCLVLLMRSPNICRASTTGAHPEPLKIDDLLFRKDSQNQPSQHCEVLIRSAESGLEDAENNPHAPNTAQNSQHLQIKVPEGPSTLHKVSITDLAHLLA